VIRLEKVKVLADGLWQAPAIRRLPLPRGF